MKDLEMAVALATQPRNAFLDLDARPRFLFPLLLTLVTSIGILVWYYSVVDIEWVIDQSLAGNPRTANMPEAQREQITRAMTRTTLSLSALGAGVVLILLLRTLEATYLLLAGKVVNLQRSFRHWFAFAWWSGLPAVISVIPAVVLMTLRDSNQVGAEVLQPLSLNELFFHIPIGGPGYSLLSNLSVLTALAWILSVIGIRVWSSRSWLFSTLFALLPVLIGYGGWIYFAFGRS